MTNTSSSPIRIMMNAIIENASMASYHEMARAELEKLDSRNTARAVKNAEKRAAEYAPLIEKAVAYLKENGGSALSADVAKGIGENTSKMAYVVKALVAEGKATSEKVKVPKIGERVKVTLVEE